MESKNKPNISKLEKHYCYNNIKILSKAQGHLSNIFNVVGRKFGLHHVKFLIKNKGKIYVYRGKNPNGSPIEEEKKEEEKKRRDEIKQQLRNKTKAGEDNKEEEEFKLSPFEAKKQESIKQKNREFMNLVADAEAEALEKGGKVPPLVINVIRLPEEEIDIKERHWDELEGTIDEGDLVKEENENKNMTSEEIDQDVLNRCMFMFLNKEISLEDVLSKRHEKLSIKDLKDIVHLKKLIKEFIESNKDTFEEEKGDEHNSLFTEDGQLKFNLSVIRITNKHGKLSLINNVQELKDIVQSFTKSSHVYFNIRPAFKVNNDIDEDRKEDAKSEESKVENSDTMSQSAVSISRNMSKPTENIAGESDPLKEFSKVQKFRLCLLVNKFHEEDISFNDRELINILMSEQDCDVIYEEFQKSGEESKNNAQ